MGFLDYLRVLRARWWVVVLLTVVGGAAAFAWVRTQPEVYGASGSAMVTAGVAPDLETAELGDRYARSLVTSYLDVAQSSKVGDYAAENLGLDVTGEELAERVTVWNPEDSPSLQFYATGDTPEQAQALVEEWMAGTAAVMAGIESGGSPDPGDPVVRLEVLDNAALPEAPVSPNVQRTVVMGALGGLVLGVGAALIWGALDRRLRRAEDVRRHFSLPVLGAIPMDRSFSKVGPLVGGDRSATKEALRALRTNLQFIDVDHPPRVIVISSAQPGDGKTTVSYKLADVMAALGRDVVLIDADLRRPRLADYLGLEGGVGLTDVLVGRVEAKDVLQRYGDTGHLRVMAAGQEPPNPSELVASEAMHDLLYSFPEDTIVLVDTPPLVAVTDASVLAARTDGALVVARAGRTTVDLLDRALANLDSVEGRPFGVILNGVALKGVHREAYTPEYYGSTHAKPGRKGRGRAVRPVEAPRGATPELWARESEDPQDPDLASDSSAYKSEEPLGGELELAEEATTARG